MKYYLSSFEIGSKQEDFKRLIPNGKVGYIPNARDFTGADLERSARRTEKDMHSLRELGVEVELLDLQVYFGKLNELKQRLKELGAIFISGGNVFVLRQAMKLSGLDQILQGSQPAPDFLYSGYSAAGCVLAPNLKPYLIVDQVDTPYSQQHEIIWDGLGLIDYTFLPHWDSNHPESADVEKAITYCKENGIPYRAIRDGEVIIIE